MKKLFVFMANSLVLSGIVLSSSIVAAEAPKNVAALYTEECSICHGDKGDAQTRSQSGMFPKPRDFTTAQAAIELTRERMIRSTIEGRPGTAMMAHRGRLSENQVVSLVDYIRASFMQVPVAEKSGIPATVGLGEKLYTENCRVCHGDDGNTAYWAQNGLNPPPQDFTSPEAQSNLTRERMIHAVTNGRPGTGMTSFSTQLSTEEITAVVDFIRFKFMGVDLGKDTGVAPMAQVTTMAQTPEPKSASPHAGGIPGVDTPLAAARPSQAPVDPHQQMPHQGAQPQAASTMLGMPQAQKKGHSMDADMTLPAPNGLKGDLAWGRDFYMQSCSVCHGVTGEGDGPRAYFIFPRPRNFSSEASRRMLNKPRIFDGIKKGLIGTVMPAWGKVLTEQEIANLTEFVFQTFIQPPTETGKKKAS